MLIARRMLLTGLAWSAGGAVLGGSATAQVDSVEPPAPSAATASSLAPAAVRGQGKVCWSASGVGPAFALTFDDGPTAQLTGRVLDLLARHGVTATFFVIGALAERHPDLLRRARDAGHEIANHSYDHVSAAATTRAAVQDSMARGADVVERLVGIRPRWYRPPRGEVTSATLIAALQTQQDLALWSVARDDGDLADADAAGVARHLRQAIHAGAVVDLHDGLGRSALLGHPDPRLMARRHAELAALPMVLPRWRDAGLVGLTLSSLIPSPTSVTAA